jgi:non-specific protein-tyrosine kinase
LAAPGQTAAIAVRLSNAWATVLGDKLTSVAAAHQSDSTKAQSSSDGSTPPTGYEVVVPASVYLAKKTAKPTSNLSSSHKVRLVAGLVVGLLVGAAVVLVRELLNKRLQKAARAAAHFKFPVVAEIPDPSADSGGQGSQMMVVVVSDPASKTAEAYRKLRMSVMFEAMAPVGARANALNDPYADTSFAMLAPAEPYSVPAPDSRKVILVVSPDAEQSRSELVANLAAAYAEAGERVIVISTGDLDSGVPAGTGTHLTGAITPAELQVELRPSSIENVSTLSLRPFVRNSAQLVGRADAVFGAARQIADVVIVEAPPLLEFHHGEALVHAVDVVLAVAEYRFTTFHGADQAGDLLRRLGAPVLGVVFTREPVPKREADRQSRSATPVAQAETGAEVEVAPATPEVPSLFPAETQA